MLHVASEQPSINCTIASRVKRGPVNFCNQAGQNSCFSGNILLCFNDRMKWTGKLPHFVQIANVLLFGGGGCASEGTTWKNQVFGREGNNELYLKRILEVYTRFRRMKHVRDEVSFKSGNELLFHKMKSFKLIYPKISLNI